MATRETKKLKTARRIRQQAGQLFLQHGVESVSVEDIAAAAGVSRASLFNYYRGKTAILQAMAGELEPRLLKLLDHYMDKPLGTADRLRELFAYSGRVLAQTAPLTRLMFVHGSGGVGFPALEREFVRLADMGQRQGDLRDDLSAAELGSVMYLAYVAGLLGWCREGQDGQFEEEAMKRRADTLVSLLECPG